jgi:hypothetical protein
MRGHDDVIRMRRAGEAPSMVRIETDEGFNRFGFGAHPPHGTDQPQIFIGPTEAAHRLDLRFVVGLFVQVNGCNGERVAAVAQACINANADRVLGVTHREQGQGEFRHFPVISVTDTKGVMAWQE